jgi:hypothetical protein
VRRRRWRLFVGGQHASTPPPAIRRCPIRNTAHRISAVTAGCDGAAVSGAHRAEVEPYVAVNPRSAASLIGVWQQDRWSNGGARGLLAGVSFMADMHGPSAWRRFALYRRQCRQW